mgnify:CR=1 FL=1
MLRDITIGQHFPGNSLVHRFDPRLKLVLTVAYIVLLFAASNPLGLTLSILFLGVMYKVAKIPVKMIGKSLKPILPIVLFTAVLNLFFVSGEGDPLVHFWFLNIYAEGVRYAVLMAVRVMALIAGTSLLTYTTSPIVLTDAIEQLLKPLGKLHFPVHELAMMMSIALRFIPTLIEETDKIMNAQKARGAQLDTGKMTDRVKALVPVLIPLFISNLYVTVGVILINRNESEARRFFDLAHELFHALTWDAMKPDHRESNSVEDRNKGKRIEQLANSFAAALLMPRISLDKLIDRNRLDDIAHLCEVAALLRVAPVTLAWRLFNLKLIGDDARRNLSQETQRPSVSGPPKRFSPTFVKMLHEALENGRLSARKAAKAMGLGLGGLTELFAQYDLAAPFEL